MHQKILILDFGGQYAHLIASRIRRMQVLAEIRLPEEVQLEELRQPHVKGIILSGGPQSVFEEDSPRCDTEIFSLGKPVLGICYGHQYLNHSLGGIVTPGKVKEYGPATVEVDWACPLFAGIPQKSTFWMSHGDEVSTLAPGFLPCAKTSDCSHAAAWDPNRKLFGIQFHPEVTHSEFGSKIFENFLNICEAKGDWTLEKFLEEHTKTIQQQIGDREVVLFVSGGVDSSVCLAFLTKVLGADRVRGLFVDTGLLRHNEVPFVEDSLRRIGANVTVMREADRFLSALEGVTDPEQKRSIIGNTFLDVQREYFDHHDLAEDAVLAQGTIYPDTIETGGTKHSSTIKTHHNRVPEIQRMIDQGNVIEPVADLYKDEVRRLGELLGLPHELVWRHPFPGPGLGVRILCSGEVFDETLDKIEDALVLPIKSVGVQGDFRTYRHPAVLPFEKDIPALQQRANNLINANADVNRAITLLGRGGEERPLSHAHVQKTGITSERVARLQRADAIVMQTLEKMDLYGSVWQFPVVMIPIAFDGQGKESIVLRPIDSIDAMSATVPELPWAFYEAVVGEILQDEDISAVFLDITSKPPGTIEWE